MGSSPIPDPTQDKDFMNANPSDQMAYLRATDKDFAAASPQDQLGYLMHLRGLSPNIAPAAGGQFAGTATIPSKGGRISPQAAASMQSGPEGLEADPNNPHPTAGLPGLTGNRPVLGRDLVPGALAGGAAAMAATPTLAGGAATALIPKIIAAGKWAEANPMKAWLALQAAKEFIPGAKKAAELVKKAPSGQ